MTEETVKKKKVRVRNVDGSKNAKSAKSEDHISKKVQYQKLLVKNYQKTETAIALMTLAILAFTNVFVTHLFNGANEYWLLAICSLISFGIELTAFGLIYYCMTHYDGKDFKRYMQKLTILIGASLAFTAVVKLLIVIFF